MAVAEQEQQQEEQAQEQPQERAPGVARFAERLYHWSTWVHVGPGAENCEDISEGESKNECTNKEHFHAWCRLPNALQEEEIREIALAAKARRTRQLRDEDSDAYAMVDFQIEQIRDEGEESTAPRIIDELLKRRELAWFLEAVHELAEEVDEEYEVEDEDDERPKLWAGVQSDEQRAIELAGMDPDERDEDELQSLTKHLKAYEDRLNAVREEKARPMREELEALDFDDLLERLRRARIEADARERFTTVYNREEWLRCTLRAPAGFAEGATRVFSSTRQIEELAPEVEGALTEAFNDLEQARNAVVQAGNS
jgi:hypothetical protein